MRRIITSAALAMGLATGFAAAQETKSDKPRESEASEVRGNKGKLKLIDLNTATEAELRQLPGVDKAMAKKIIENRPYITVEDLARSGIPVQVQRDARMQVTVTPRTPTDATGSASRQETPRKDSGKQKESKEQKKQ